MRCYSCNCVLNDFEATRKVEETGEYLDMCNDCVEEVFDDIPTISRPDLNPKEQATTEDTLYEVDEADAWLFNNDDGRS